MCTSLYDLVHMQRRPIILCSNDAKSCYDRIIHSIASLAMQRLGLPFSPMKSSSVSRGPLVIRLFSLLTMQSFIALSKSQTAILEIALVIA